jgi:hypothetical protein
MATRDQEEKMKLARTLNRFLELTLGLLLVTLSFAPSAHAAIPNVVAGELVGASMVNVGGVLYDVEFVEGTCISVFDGCDSTDDFAFTDLATVDLASQALLDQVFLDGTAGSFDTDLTATAGCASEAVCTAQTPYSLPDIDHMGVGIALNYTDEANDSIGDGQNERTVDSSVGAGQFYMFAVWTPSAVQAATPVFVDGQLRGASNVDVGGVLYDVAFVEGTCISVFDGCDSADDFALGDLATVTAASQALLDQVFLDRVEGAFDSDPTTTYGCTNAGLGSVQTPYSLIDADNIGVGIALNASAEVNDGIADGSTQKTADSSVGAGQFYVFAAWTPAAVPAPVPGPGLLVGLALLVTGASVGRRTTR